MSYPRPAPEHAQEAGPQLTTCWHAAGIDHAVTYALNVYLGLALVAVAFLALWAAYVRATNGD